MMHFSFSAKHLLEIWIEKSILNSLYLIALDDKATEIHYFII